MHHNKGSLPKTMTGRHPDGHYLYSREPAPNDSHYISSGYHRSSSSSTASSGHRLVKKSPQERSYHGVLIDRGIKERQEMSYPIGRDPKYQTNDKETPRRDSEERRNKLEFPSSESSSSDERKRTSPPMFILGSPSSSSEYHSSLRSTPSSSTIEGSSSSASSKKDSLHPPLKPEKLLDPGYSLHLHPDRLLTTPDRRTKIGSIYDTYWHIPRASLWCSHKERHDEYRKCSQCQLKEDDVASTCSSINPPPTFTDVEIYNRIRKRPSRCSCGAVFAITTAFCTLVLLLIMAFILYIEMVLKRKEYIPDPM